MLQLKPYYKRFPVKNKSPLRYPGGKQNAIHYFLNRFPSDVEAIVSPFLGGGSIELCLAANGILVFASDNDYGLVNFWRHLIGHYTNSRANLIENAKYHKSLMCKSYFKTLQETEIKKYAENLVTDPSAYFALNRSSYSGVVLRSGCSDFKRFTDGAIKTLEKVNTNNFLYIGWKDYQDQLIMFPEEFAYLDPPYYGIDNLYGHPGSEKFDHERFFDIIKQRSSRWFLFYNDCSYIRKLYKDYRIESVHWKYGMNDSKKSSELIITNYDPFETGG